MEKTIAKIESQVYLLPYIKITYDRILNGKYEFAMRRAVYTLFKERYRSKAKEMYIRCYLLLKLNVF